MLGVFPRTHFLVLQQVKAEFVSTRAERHPARFMVSSHHDERFIGVLLVELQRHFHRFVKVECFLDHCGSVIRMACPVDLTAFDGEEETVLVLFHQEINPRAYDGSKCKIVLATVDGIGQGCIVKRISFVGLQKHQALGFLNLLVVNHIPLDKGITCIFIELVKGYFVGAVFVRRLQERRTCVEVKLCLQEVVSNAVVVTARGFMSIETCGSRMVNAYRSSHTDRHTFFLSCSGYAENGSLSVGRHRDNPVLRFLPRSKGCPTCCRVGHTIRGRFRMYERHMGE